MSGTSVFSSIAQIALALWVGGLALFMGVVAPVSFRRFSREEAGRYLGVLFPAVDRWTLVWAVVTCASLYGLFLKQHFAPRSLVLELPVAAMAALTYYAGVVLHPQIQDLRRRLTLPELQGTAHQAKLEFAFGNLHRASVRVHAAILFLGLFALACASRLL